jgi:DNA-binding MarR family transcriptional regulator
MATERDPSRERAFHLLARTMSRLDPGRLEAWVELGLTMTQVRVLFLLRNDDGASAGGLADALSVTPSTLTRIVDRLVSSGLVRREADACDRRLVRHRLSDKGARTVEELERGGRARLNEVMDRLSKPQLDRLLAGLEDLTAALDVEDAGALSGVEA